MRPLRPLALLLLPACLLMAGDAKTQAPKSKGYVGCTDTKLFHKGSCAYVKEIEKAGTKVTFSKRSEAVQAGYKPCTECKP